MNDILVAIISALSSSGFMSLILYKVKKSFENFYNLESNI